MGTSPSAGKVGNGTEATLAGAHGPAGAYFAEGFLARANARVIAAAVPTGGISTRTTAGKVSGVRPTRTKAVGTN